MGITVESTHFDILSPTPPALRAYGPSAVSNVFSYRSAYAWFVMYHAARLVRKSGSFFSAKGGVARVHYYGRC